MILVDTSIWIEFLLDAKRLPAAQANLADFVTCGPVMQELLQGFADRHSIDVFRDRLLAFPCLSDPLPLDLYIKASNIYRKGRLRDFTILSSVDCLIAAIAMENNVTVWHRDRDFTAIARSTPLMIFR